MITVKGKQIIKASGEYVIANMSLNKNLSVYGGTNSTLHITLMPRSVAIIWAENEFTLEGDSIPVEFYQYIEPKPLPPTINLPLTDKKFCLDAGHGGHDPGAVNKLFDLAEKDAALAIILDLGSVLEMAGATVIYTRDDDTFVGLTNRAKIANEANVDAFISVHLNAAENTGAMGTEILVYKTSGTANDLATKVLNNIIKSIGTKNRGVKARPDLTVLAKTKMPAILVETGFISNNEEAQQLFDPEIQWNFAEAIYNGILEQFA